MNISGQDADLFPTLPAIENEREVSLPQDMLRDMIRKTEFAIAAEDMREVLTGCLLEIETAKWIWLRRTASGWRFAAVRCSDVLEKFSAIIPGRAVSDIGKLLSGDENAFANLSFGGGKLHIGLDRTDIYVILVAGQYVNYRQILPKSFAAKVVMDLEPFRRCVDRAQLIAREGTQQRRCSESRTASWWSKRIRRSATCTRKPDVQQDGANMNIAFNVKYLIDVVRHIDAEQIEIHLNNAEARASSIRSAIRIIFIWCCRSERARRTDFQNNLSRAFANADPAFHGRRSMIDKMLVRGARVHNLKNIDVDVPLNRNRRRLPACPARENRRWRWAFCMRKARGGIWKRFQPTRSRRMTQAAKAVVDEVLVCSRSARAAPAARCSRHSQHASERERSF